MKLYDLKIIAITFMAIISTNSHASLISYDLLTANSLPQVSYSNPFNGNFSSAEDGFQIYQKNDNAPKALIDNSTLLTSDNLGIINSTNTQAYFGIVDSVNPDNPSSDAVASWKIDIADLTAITLFINMAAMGDFESNDEFLWHYSIDNNPYSNLFQGSSNESSAQTYRLENDSVISLDDPMTVNSQMLSNEFQTFSSVILDTGSLLTLELKAKTNGGSEAIAFQNILLQGRVNNVRVTEPTSLNIMLLAGLLLLVKSSFSY